MRIMLTGKNGQLGAELEKALAPLGELIAFDRNGCDLSDPDAVISAVRACKPGVIVNAAAYTAVDSAESHPDVAFAINARGPGILAEEARRTGALMVHYSTDYVFDGAQNAPYVESDAPNPLNEYGRSKLAGEAAIQASGAAHLIFRTSWVYGVRGKNFMLTMLKLAKERQELRIVDDQVGAPTWSRELALATAEVLSQLQSRACGEKEPPRRIYHLTAAGSTTWHGFAQHIFASLAALAGQKPPRLIPISSGDYPSPAKRPKYSVLSNAAFVEDWGFELGSWEEAVRACLAEHYFHPH